MMQEILNGTNVGGILGGERSRLSNSVIPKGSPNSQSPAAGGAAAMENLRCPRCDSSNTKFCYYNNYNLTQPRHFCKTCRRYWTKGGALRNVPIGGGCRKNKSTAIATVVGKSSSTGKLKTVTNDITKSALFGGNFDHAGAGAESTLVSNPIIWPQNSHFLSLLRSNQNPNPNLGHLPNSIKEEAALFGSSNWSSESSTSGRVMNLDPLAHLHITPNSIYRNQTQAILPCELQSNGYHELYQRLRSSTSCYPDHQATVIPGNMSSVITSPNSGILESAPVSVTGGELGFWNSSNLSWLSDLPTTTTNGAYP